ncbi:hypothetical protein R1sor_001306 [Riccia sorocarpa]|uniref:Protein kinase domain-containing protein n=1 Tax=Riccia sorocarpa TaxID=122646 RepID=A0ABD3H1K2_9MARC
MGWTQQSTQEWGAKLEPGRAEHPFTEFNKLSSLHSSWLTARLTSASHLWSKKKEIISPQQKQRETSLRVSFPVRFGLCPGAVGGVDSSAFAVHLVQVKVGDEIGSFAPESERDYPVRNGSSKLGQKLELASNVANAASILLLSQAFCGPVISSAMGIMALAELTRFTISRVRDFMNKDSQGPGQFEGWSLPSRLHDFTTASLLLSIGVPILKYQNPNLHYTLECVGAALPVAAGYAKTKARVQQITPGSAGLAEGLWRSRHRWAAKRLCSYLTDFQNPPRVGRLVDIWEKTTVLITGRRLIVGSMALPLIIKYSKTSKVAATGLDIFKEDLPSKQLVPVSVPFTDRVPRTPELLGEQTRNLSVSVSSWNSGADDIYLKFSVVQSGWCRVQQRSALVFRTCYLVLIFGPLIIFGPVIYFISTLLITSWAIEFRKVLWGLLRFCLERGGAAFIKWGQWSATREDLFPEDLCLYLGRLHDRAPEHSYNRTRKAVLENLGRPIEDIFVDFPTKPCASGSIAQVYRAKLKDRRDGMPSEVAVKVRHPNVALRIFQDFQIMSVLANWAERLPALRWLKLRESVDQFSHTLTAQADLRFEASNLARFQKNFEGLNSTVIFPKLFHDLVSEGVIVESFERGSALHEFLRHRSSLNTQIAAVGVDTYLKMLLTDNFVHTDLHPGNIMARSSDGAEGIGQKLQLVLLDFGLAEELSPLVRYHFLSFIMMIGAGNGERAAYHLLQFSWPHEQTCRTPEYLVKDMRDLFNQECDLERHPIDLNKVLIKVLHLCRKHEVTIDSAYASLVIAVCVLVGFARSLDPEMSIMDAAVPCLFTYSLTGRIQGRIYG